jgi:uncharacterized membrane protein YeaQ/YmgE (transglycosylase-associated protein family)
MDWLVLIIAGIVVGLIANVIHPSRNTWGLFGDLFLGIVGIFFGEWVAGLLGIAVNSLLASVIAGVIGALLLLVIWGFIKSALFKNKTTTSTTRSTRNEPPLDRDNDQDRL